MNLMKVGNHVSQNLGLSRMKKLIVVGQLSAKKKKTWQITMNECTIKMFIIFIGVIQKKYVYFICVYHFLFIKICQYLTEKILFPALEILLCHHLRFVGKPKLVLTLSL